MVVWVIFLNLKHKRVKKLGTLSLINFHFSLFLKYALLVIYQFSLMATQYLSFFILLVNVDHKLRMQRMLLLFGLDS